MKILHLFHDLMNLYGEYANTLALQRALSEKGESAEISRLSVGDTLDFSEYDFIYIGSGTERSQKAALEYLKPYKEALRSAMDIGKIVLATGNSFEIFGSKINDRNGKEYDGLGLFDFITKEYGERIVTDSAAEFEGNEIIGFINKASQIYDIDKPFFTVKQGAGNCDSCPGFEGICDGNFYGTHLIGPLLIRNKCLAEYFAELLIADK